MGSPAPGAGAANAETALSACTSGAAVVPALDMDSAIAATTDSAQMATCHWAGSHMESTFQNAQRAGQEAAMR